jgi:hypothetical protein
LELFQFRAATSAQDYLGLDTVIIAVIGSGFYLWIVRRTRKRGRLQHHIRSVAHVSAPGAARSDWLRVFTAPSGLAAAGSPGFQAVLDFKQSWISSSLGFVVAFLWGDIGRYLSWLGIGLPLIVVAWLGASRLLSHAVPR